MLLFKLNSLGWNNLTTDTQGEIHKALMVYKSLNGFAPEYLCSRFVNRNDITSYSLRDSANKIAVPFLRTNYLRTSLRYSGAVLWNGVPLNVRASGILALISSISKQRL